MRTWQSARLHVRKQRDNDLILPKERVVSRGRSPSVALAIPPVLRIRKYYRSQTDVLVQFSARCTIVISEGAILPMLEAMKIGSLTELSLESLEAFFPSETSMPAKQMKEKPEDEFETRRKQFFSR